MPGKNTVKQGHAQVPSGIIHDKHKLIKEKPYTDNTNPNNVVTVCCTFQERREEDRDVQVVTRGRH